MVRPYWPGKRQTRCRRAGCLLTFPGPAGGAAGTDCEEGEPSVKLSLTPQEPVSGTQPLTPAHRHEVWMAVIFIIGDFHWECECSGIGNHLGLARRQHWEGRAWAYATSSKHSNHAFQKTRFQATSDLLPPVCCFSADF